VDTVIGLNNIGKVLVGNFPNIGDVVGQPCASVNMGRRQGAVPDMDSLIQGVFKPKRVKFQKGSQHLSFRLYQSSSSRSRACRSGRSTSATS
jgi:hypothetical protein